jgi:hypothetical protein
MWASDLGTPGRAERIAISLDGMLGVRRREKKEISLKFVIVLRPALTAR